jgi:LL-diaminopimelate aminotransferase
MNCAVRLIETSHRNRKPGLPVRRIVIDKANRLYQMPPEVSDFIAPGRMGLLRGRREVTDLALFVWPVGFEPDVRYEGDALLPASERQIASLKEELASWLSRTHGVRIVADKEILLGGGGISGLVHQMALAYIDVGDVAFVPGVGIPLYRACITACGGEPIPYGISAKTDWAPQSDRLKTGLGRVARLLFLNSPHNPTGSELSAKQMSELAWLAGRQNILVVNDAAYASISTRPPASLLSVPGGKKIGVEVASFAYQFGLPPLSLGYAAGSREAISGLEKTTRLAHSYIPSFAVELAIEAIRHYPNEHLAEVRNRIARAMSEATALLDLLHLERSGKPSVPYEWAKLERRTPSTNLAKTLLRRFKIAVAPGLSFGENGEGFVRFSLLAGPGAFREAARRIRKSRLTRKREEEA